MKQMYSNNAVVVSTSTSLPIVSAGSLASMMQVDFPLTKNKARCRVPTSCVTSTMKYEKSVSKNG